MPRGDGLKKYWEQVRNGERELPENIGKRGKDKPGTVRPIGDNRTLQARYYERTGRRMDMEMADERAMIDMMFDAASEIDDPVERLNQLAKVQSAQSKFNANWARYTEHQLGTLKTEQTVEDKISLDDALSGNLQITDETE